MVFAGSLSVCCDPGRGVRRAMRELIGAANDTQIVDTPRAAGGMMPGATAREQMAHYRRAGEQMASAVFCLVPGGDNEVSSRLCGGRHLRHVHSAPF